MGRLHQPPTPPSGSQGPLPERACEPEDAVFWARWGCGPHELKQLLSPVHSGVVGRGSHEATPPAEELLAVDGY